MTALPPPFGCALKSALRDESFLPEGGQLRFAAQRSYDFADEQQRFSAAALRGPDLAVAAAAQQFGGGGCWGKVRVQRVWSQGWYGWGADQNPTYDEPQEEDDGFNPRIVWVRRPQQYHPDSARVEVCKLSLDVGKSACMLVVYVKPFSKRSQG